MNKIYEIMATFEVEAASEQEAEDRWFDVIIGNPETHDFHPVITWIKEWDPALDPEGV